MNADDLAPVLICGLPVLAVGFAVHLLLFRLACRIARVQLPTFARTVAVTLLAVAIEFVLHLVLPSVVAQVYSLAGYPWWEGGIVGFFVGLPALMMLLSFAHAKLVGIRFGEALTVFFVERAIKLGVLALGSGLLGLLVVLARANG